MERSLARVGNPEYAIQNNSFGLTTLRNDHVRIKGGRVVLDFRGKHGILHHKVVADAKLARILEHCHDLPGAELFKYFDEAGQLRHVSSEDVNRYLREITGRHITAKDFRTWAGTNLAVLEIVALQQVKPRKRSAAAVVRRVPEELGNTPAVCRKSYIHPRVLSSYLDGSLRPVLATARQCMRAPEIWAVEGIRFTKDGGWTCARSRSGCRQPIWVPKWRQCANGLTTVHANLPGSHLAVTGPFSPSPSNSTKITTVRRSKHISSVRRDGRQTLRPGTEWPKTWNSGLPRIAGRHQNRTVLTRHPFRAYG
jgi:hypothetical protein